MAKRLSHTCTVFRQSVTRILVFAVVVVPKTVQEGCRWGTAGNTTNMYFYVSSDPRTCLLCSGYDVGVGWQGRSVNGV